jgi:hypothetical protein
MLTGTPRRRICGTQAGLEAHRHAGEDPCAYCVRADEDPSQVRQLEARIASLEAEKAALAAEHEQSRARTPLRAEGGLTALPDGLETVTVTGTFNDAAGNPLPGRVLFTPSSAVSDASGEVIIEPMPVTCELVSGSFTSPPLVATDNSGLTPSGWTYLVSLQVVGAGQRNSFSVAIPHTPSPTDLTALVPVQALVPQVLTTSAEVPLPVSQGGTGASTPSAAQASLGLGSAATQPSSAFDAAGAAAAVAAVAPSDWHNVVTGYGADPAGADDSTDAIQDALTAVASAGGTVYVPAGMYKISSALTVSSGVTVQGAGEHAAVITQTSTTADGISGTDVSHVTIRDLGLSGPGSGSGSGIAITASSDPNIAYIDIENVIAASFGNIGVHLDTPIVTHLRKVLAMSNGGDGFQLSNVKSTPTSVTLESCYADGNAGIGFELDGAAYCALDGCASDGNAIGYGLYSCQGVTLSGCGTETFTTAGWVFDGCTGCTLNGGRTYNGAGIVAHVTDGTVQQTITGLVETSPAAGATASIETDSGTSSVIINPAVVTAASYATGTAYVIDGTGGAAH